MDHRVDAVLAHHLGEPLRRVVPGEVEHLERRAADPIRSAGRQVVDDHDGRARLLQETDDMGADVSGATGDEHSHGADPIRRT